MMSDDIVRDACSIVQLTNNLSSRAICVIRIIYVFDI